MTLLQFFGACADKQRRVSLICSKYNPSPVARAITRALSACDYQRLWQEKLTMRGRAIGRGAYGEKSLKPPVFLRNQRYCIVEGRHLLVQDLPDHPRMPDRNGGFLEMPTEKIAPPKPISSSDVPWKEWAEVPRISARYRHLTRAAVGEDYRVGVAIEELAPAQRESDERVEDATDRAYGRK